jgi:dihydroorotase
MRAGPAAARLGLAGWPPDAELRVVERDIAMAQETGARLHLTHLATRGAVEAVRDAKARGVAVTADVTPHHLALTDEWVGGSRRYSWEDAEDGAVGPNAYDGSCRVNPPLASREDALALLAGVRDGVIDAIATDHAPHSSDRKLVPFGEASPGLIGLETALSLGLAAMAAGALTLPVLLAALSTRPAAVIGERRTLAVGAPADVTMFDPGARWRVDRSALASRSANTPLMGMELPGVVRLTLASGRVTYRLS